MALPKDKLPVLEEFVSVQGEGLNIGKPYYFIRVGGCPLRCNFCDSDYTWALDKDSIVNIVDVAKSAVASCQIHGIEWISITGGEPLLYEDQLKDMMAIFYKAGLKTHIETSGRYYDEAVHNMSDIYSVDAKTPCTGEIMDGYFLGLENLRKGDQVKCLISDQEDLDYAYEVNKLINGKCTTVLQPFNETVKSLNDSRDFEILDSIRHNMLGQALKNTFDLYHKSSWNWSWKNVIITPQIHVFAYGNAKSR